MTKDGDLWTVETVGDPTGIIFNNGSGVQTGNLTYVDGATYDMNGVVGQENPEWTVKFNNSKSNWEDVYCYTFSGGSKFTGNWPGTKMEMGSDGIYAITFKSASAPENVVFNNGKNGNEEKKTADLSFVNNTTYDLNGVVVEETKANYYIVTAVNETWNFSNQIELEEGEDGLYTASIPAEVGHFFISKNKMTDWGVPSTATRYYPANSTEDVAVDKDGSYSFTTVNNSKVWTKPASEITISINFSTNKFTADVPVQNISSTYYLIGTGVEGLGNWQPNLGLEGKFVENYVAKEGPFAENPFTGFIFSNVTLEAGNYFNFAPALGDNASDWSKSKPRIAPAGGADYTFEKTLSGNEYAETAVGFFTDNEKSFSAQPGKYLICLDAANKKLYLFNADNTTGVEDVVIDLNAPAEYYNLNGVKVENPATGIYIVRQGGKTFKAVIR